MKLTWQQGSMIVCGVVAVIIAAGGFLVAVRPQQTKLKSVDEQIATAQAQFAGLHATAGKKPQIDAAQLFQLSRAMPKADDMAGILLDLSQIATSSKVSLISVAPQSRVALADGSSAVPMQVTIAGSWSQVTAFLRDLRDQVQLNGKRLTVGGRVFDVDQVQLSAQQTKQPIQALLTLSAFDFGAPPSATATAGQGAPSTTTTTTTSSGSQQAAGATGGGS
ncbi:MAG TPA: type 4a pilus biogenesis protein PilO [Gaiellaceae bacterium]